VAQTTGLKWLGLAAGEEGELKKLEQTTTDKRIFIKIGVCVREGKVMATGSEEGLRKQCGRCVAVEEDDRDSRYYLICDGTIVCLQ